MNEDCSRKNWQISNGSQLKMVVIRRAVDKNKSYTVIFLKGEEPKWIITSDYEHARILQIYKQDRRYEGIINDFNDFDL